MKPALLSLLALSAFACSEPEPDVSGGFGRREAREIILTGAPSEGGPRGPLEPASPSLRDVFTQLHAIATTESARGLFLRVEPMGGAWGRAADLVEALAEVRAAGKPVHCHFEQADNVSYWLMAKACDRIGMTPAGSLNLVGVAAQVFYARDLLSNLGVQAEILAMGRYKSAGETFTETEMPETTREALG
ncbi:MAG: S49 family peptidase, partial [Polyangiaceae bacterium]|nr:S49 family peptidase [Polyangiaceae bacterium]